MSARAPEVWLTHERKVAIEHVLWLAGRHLTPLQMMQSVGVTWTGRRDPTIHDVVAVLVDELRRARVRLAERAALARPARAA